MTTVRLGLIGGNIASSRSPLLHEVAGRMVGIDVRYDLIVPAERGLSFDDTFHACADEGYRGLNITYPFKERVVSRLTIEDPAIAAIGACNTVLFGSTPPLGANTDYTGFVQAFRGRFGEENPGRVAMAGAGGVGKAIAFGLGALGAKSLTVFDPDQEKARALVAAILLICPTMQARATNSIVEAATDADGLINSTPVGMGGTGGTAFPKRLLGRQRWAFDAVYTPVNTPFVLDARARGLDVMSGYELFLYQGIDAFRLFTGHTVNAESMRRALEETSELRNSS